MYGCAGVVADESLAQTDAVFAVSVVSGDERLLAVGLTSGDLSVIDARTGMTLVTFARGSSPVVSVRFHDDGRIAVERRDGRSESLQLPM